MKRWQVISLVVLLLIMTFLPGCGSGTGNQPTEGQKQGAQAGKVANLRVGGSTTSTWIYGFLVALSENINAKLPDVKLNVQATAGSSAHYNMFQKGELDLASGGTFTDLQASNGQGIFKAKFDKFYTILPATVGYCQVVAAKKSGISKMSDLANKTIGIGGRGSPTSEQSESVIKALGIKANIKTSTHEEMIEMFKDGRVDALVYFGGAPYSGILDISSANEVVLIPFTEEELKKVNQAYPALSIGKIPQKAYPFLTGDVPTVQMIQTVLISKAVSDDIAYKITKAAWESWDQVVKAVPAAGSVSIKDAVNFVVPIHPGAIKYYEEKGIKIPQNLKP